MSQQSSDSNPLAGKHIIVAGGGIAGLAFARGLTHFWPSTSPPPSISLYERDPRTLPAGRGNYSLGLRSDKLSGGIQALQRLGLIDQIWAARTPNSEYGATIRNAKWEPIMRSLKKGETPSGLPAAEFRITRNSLRETLVNGISEDVSMHWEVGCDSAATTKDGKMEVVMSDGSREVCDLLVIADGASSKLRKCLRPEDTLDFAGAVTVGGNSTFKTDADVPDRLKEGPTVATGEDGHALICFPVDGERKYIWFVTRRSATPRKVWRDVEDPKVQEQLIQEALTEGKAFAEPFPSLVAAADRSTLRTMNAQDKKGITHPQDPALPYVFIGDANHAMSPFAGNGANFALMDGASLAQKLCDSPSVSSAVKAFDEDCLPRCTKSYKISHMVITLMHSSGWLLWITLFFLRIVRWFQG